MRKLLLGLIVTAALCVPAVSIAANPPTAAKLAASMCRSIRAQDGRATFRHAYHSFAGCLRTMRPDARADIHNAAQTCRAERNDPNFAATHDGKTFQQFYGTNAGNAHGAGSNAFGKCVSTLAKQNAQSDVSNNVDAAKTCKALKASDPDTFKTSYGSGRNAFGKCVSATAHADNG
jgi:hypothetical protein